MPAIPRDRPLVIARLKADGPDPRYSVYCAAYGIEMQFDPDWRVTLVLLAPPEHLAQLTESTDVRSLGIQVGVSAVPADLGPKPETADWVLVEESGLKTALGAGWRCVAVAGTDLSGLSPEELSRVAVVARVGEVVRVREAAGVAAVLLAGGSADDIRAAGADGVFLDGDYGEVLTVCRALGQAGG